jgi:hypothetical protein
MQPALALNIRTITVATLTIRRGEYLSSPSKADLFCVASPIPLQA